MFYHFRSKNRDFLEDVGFLSPKDIDKAIYIINSYLSNVNLNQGYMIHVDLSLDHIYHHNGNLQGIIDFNNVGSGDPLYDIATFEFYTETKYPSKDYSKFLKKAMV